MSQDDQSHIIALQRMRNRLIEWLEQLVDFQSDPPPYDINEVVNQWGHWEAADLPSPPYTNSERIAPLEVNQAVDAFCKATPNPIPSGLAFESDPTWRRLVLVSRQALDELRIRDRLSEDVMDLG